MVTFSSLLKAAPLLAAAILSTTESAHARRGDRSPLRKDGNLAVPTNDAHDRSLQQLSYYPNLGSHGCLNDGNNPSWMESNGAYLSSHYLFMDLDSCCRAHFPDAMEACIESSPQVASRMALEEERELGGKSGKSNKSGKAKVNPTPVPPGPKHTHGKSGKGGKSSKAGHSHPLPIKPRNPVTPKPSRRPTKKPVSVIVPQNSVQIAMGGSLIAMNLDVPAAGSSDLNTLAGVFEQTILRVLDKGFLCDVYSIAGLPVDNGGALPRHLQAITQSEVLFNLRTVRPCPDCDDTGALLLGAEVFDDTFETLDAKAQSGELSVIFCIFAEVAGIVSEPCVVALTSVEGTSLDVAFVGDGTPPATPMPTNAIAPLPGTPPPTAPPVVPITPEPTSLVTLDPTGPVMAWPPTPSPMTQIIPTDPPVAPSTLPPVVSTIVPSTLPPVVSTIPPVVPSTMPPVVATSDPTPSSSSALPTPGISTAMPGAGSTPMPSVGSSSALPTPGNFTAMPGAGSTPMPSAGSSVASSSHPSAAPSAGVATPSPTASREILVPTLPPGVTVPTLPPVVMTSSVPTMASGSSTVPVADISSVPTLTKPSLGQMTETWRVPQNYPEGIAYDKENNRILLSSLVSNTIMSLDPANDMAVQTVYTPIIENVGGMGLKVDESSGYVYATLDTFASQDNGGLVVYDLPVSGEATATADAIVAPLFMPCTVDGTSSCGLANDAVIAGEITYVTDSALGRLFKVENGAMEEISNDPLLMWLDASFPFGSNGLIYDERGFLVVGNTGASSLVRVDLATGEVMSIPIEGTIGNVDGMLMDSNGRVFVITGTTIYVLKDNDDEWRSAVVEGTIDIDQSESGESATTAAFGETESEIYITYLRFDDLFGAGTNEDPSLIARVELGDYEAPPTATTTVAPVAGTTVAPVAGTTVAPVAGTTVAPVSGTTVAPVAGTSSVPTPSTTMSTSGSSSMPTSGSSTASSPPTGSNEPSSSTYPPTHIPTMSPLATDFIPPGSATPSSSSSTDATSRAPTSGGGIPAASIAPTIAFFPPEASYYDSFEQATFPNDAEWSTDGNATWGLSTDRAKTGTYSIKAGTLSEQGTSNVNFITSPDFAGGSLLLSVLPGVELPIDDLFYYVDGVFAGPIPPDTEWVTMNIPILPGEHTIMFSYLYNPFDLEDLPPASPTHLGAAFIDDVYILPEGVAVPMPPNTQPTSTMPTSATTPTASTTSPNMEPTSSTVPTTLPVPTSSGEPTLVLVSLAPSTTTSSIPTPGTPTSSPPTVPGGDPTFEFPPEALYTETFEEATFPDTDEWSTEGEELWALNTDRAQSGVYSIKSGALSDTGTEPKNSNVTFTTIPNFPGGSLVLSTFADVQLPLDDFLYFIDGEFAGQVTAQTEWEALTIPLEAGEHAVMFSYKYNPLGLDQLPPPSGEYTGAVFIDNVYIVSDIVGTIPPNASPSPTDSPIASGNPPVAGDAFFDGFETGDLSGLNWVVSGVPGWEVDESNPYEGSFSVHVRTDDIPISGNFSQLDLEVTLEAPAFIQFYFNAPVSMPFESFDLWVDGTFLTPLTTPDGNWTLAGAIIAPGDHMISWRYTKNPGGAPEDVLATLPQPPFRLGEAWLDNVELIAATVSFTEDWESGDFEAHPWVRSGAGTWEITDSVQYDGTYSATMLSDNIEGASGSADLSIDIITESGGKLFFTVLPSIAGPFEILNILIDDTIVSTYANVQEDWLPAELDIQPGKRKVTWQLLKNPGGLPDDVLSTIPKSPGQTGQVSIDAIDFRSN